MLRRSFIKNTGLTTIALAAGNSFAFDRKPKNILPGWRGFNLLDFYSPDPARNQHPTKEDHFKWMRDWGFDFVRMAAVTLYRLALGHPNSRVIFQNANDCEVLSRAGVIRPQQVVMVRGSGVDLDRFKATPEPKGVPVAIMVSRLLHDKGVREFVAAARASAGSANGLRWVLVGSPDPGNPASVSAAELDLWEREGLVECMGEQTDIASLYAYAHIAVLPSYREGLPKSLIEAAACARAVVTTDVPGCRDAIEPGVTGLLVPARDAAALAFAVQRLADDGDLRRRFGAAGRELAEREFDIRKVVQAHLDVYQALSA